MNNLPTLATQLRQTTLMSGTEFRLIERHGIDPELAHQMVDGLCQFLPLVAVSDSPLTPPTLIDEAWHDCLLDTRSYGTSCQDIMGIMIHHNPPLGPEPTHRDSTCLSIKETVELAQAHYGSEINPRVWRKAGAMKLSRGADV